MKTKSLAIFLVLAMLMLSAASTFSASGPPGSRLRGHPWEELNSNNGPSGSSAMVIQVKDRKVIMIPIFSDFFIWIYVDGVHNEGEHQKNSGKVGDNSYQIIFPW
jgi:hypothetical protein